MAGAIAPSLVKAGTAVTIATRADDADIRRLLRDNPSQGAISLTFEREPSYFDAASIEGDEHCAIVARDETGVVGMGARAVRHAWINGEARRTGFLSHLRLDHRARGRFAVIRAGYKLMRELHEADGGTQLYLTSIVEDNEPARRFLEAGVGGLPRYQLLDRFETSLISRGSARPPRGVTLRKAMQADVPEIVALLRRRGQRSQFSESWTAAGLMSPRCRGLSMSDFMVAEQGRLIGCAARWDQRGFRQTVISSYSPSLARALPLINALSPIFATPRLPEVGGILPIQFISHVAVEEDNAEVFRALASAVLAGARREGCMLVAGFASRHPLSAALAGFTRRRLWSRLYAVHWPDGEAAAGAIDNRPVHVEVALL
jgi:hypothetical protein